MRSEYIKLYALVQNIKFSVLSSVGDDGEMHSRPMTPLQIDHAGNIWFIASAVQHKTEDLFKNPKVNLVYVSENFETFVSICGNAKVLQDSKKLNELWDPNMQAWFPDGIAEDELVLIQVHIERAEHWDRTKGRMVQVIGPINAPPPPASTVDRSKPNLSDMPPAGTGLHH